MNNNEVVSISDLAPGTFSPRPKRAPAWKMALSQGRIESKLMLRHGEQILLNIIIPVAVLLAAALLPVLGETHLDNIVPMVFAIAATSAGFTGQAISLAFDRRYGALKRTGASGVPAWTIIVGKIIGVLTMTLVQLLIIGAVALALGWRVSIGGAVLGIIALVVGTIVFTSLGLFMGGTFRSEIVLGLANLIWLILVGIVGYVAYTGDISHPGAWLLVPSVALTSALISAFSGTINFIAWAFLLGWAAVGTLAAIKWFRFDG
ncbi:ABC transporter permease [Corynebacterium lubricantis]|uniref:ABC transporter permease n=1 Tax=Corynebacterium lubricantis TaxID=541095 RepID=UPI000377E82C|nr:ABC transporter permease [Corynebacterium lubricantis]